MKALLASFAFLAMSMAHANASSLPSCDRENAQYRFNETYSEYQTRFRRSECEKDWTVLVYMAADNDLFPYALMDLNEMEAAFTSHKGAGSTAKTDLVVQADGPEVNDLRRLHIFAGPVKYEKKTKTDFANLNLDSVKSPIVAKIPENAQSEQERLSDFLQWGAKNYPAKHYFVIVWGHGQGWKSFPVSHPVKSRFVKTEDLPEFPSTSSDRHFGGIAFSRASNSWLDIPGLKTALGTFENSLGKPIDVYASDACLMQMLEVSYELSSTARFIVGSAQVQSFLGLPYRRLMYELNTGRFNGERRRVYGSNDANDEAYLLAKMIPKLMKQSLDPNRGSQGHADSESQKFVTSSALTSEEMQIRLIPEIKNLGLSLKNYLQEDPMRTIDMQFVLQSTPAFEGGSQDFGVFLGFLDLLLISEREKNGFFSPAAADLRNAVRNAKEVLDLTILSYAYGSSYTQSQANVVGFIPRAVSLWLPVASEEYDLRKKEFARSRFYQETNWSEWLDQVYN